MRYPWYITYGIYTLVPYWVRAELEPFLSFTPVIGEFWTILKMPIPWPFCHLQSCSFNITSLSRCSKRNLVHNWDFWKFLISWFFKIWFLHFWKFDHGSRMQMEFFWYQKTSHILGYILYRVLFLGGQLWTIFIWRNISIFWLLLLLVENQGQTKAGSGLWG